MYIFDELVQPTILSMFDFFSLYLIKNLLKIVLVAIAIYLMF